MRPISGRLPGIFIALVIALHTMLGAVALASTDYVIMPPGDFNVDHSDSGHFDVYYDSLKITDAGDAMIGAEGAYGRVAGFYGPYNYLVRVILAANHQQYAGILYNYLSGEDISEDNVASGWGEGERSTIVIEAPDQIPDFESTLAYELAIIVMRTNLIGHKDSVPEWFTQGLALYVSGDLSGEAKASAARSAQDGKAMTVSEMEGILKGTSGQAASPDDVSAARAQSGMLMEYVGKLYGNDTIKLIMQDFATTGDLDTAFEKRTGSTPEEVNADWKASLGSQPATGSMPALTQQVKGYVLDAGNKPMPNETIAFTSRGSDTSMSGKTYTAVTDATGYYKLNLTSGLFSVYLDRPGYVDFNGNITLQKGEVRTYNVTLAKSPELNGQNAPQVTYAVLGIVNALAVILLAIVFWRAKK